MYVRIRIEYTNVTARSCIISVYAALTGVKEEDICHASLIPSSRPVRRDPHTTAPTSTTGIFFCKSNQVGMYDIIFHYVNLEMAT